MNSTIDSERNRGNSFIMVQPIRGRRATVTSTISVLLIGLPLVGCGDSGPGAGDIKAAINNFLDGLFGPASPLNNHMAAREIKDVSCSSAQGKPGYVCTYDLVVFDPGKNALQDQGKKTARFVKDNDKWAMMKDK
jgi:hypothetical protein